MVEHPPDLGGIGRLDQARHGRALDEVTAPDRQTGGLRSSAMAGRRLMLTSLSRRCVHSVCRREAQHGRRSRSSSAGHCAPACAARATRAQRTRAPHRRSGHLAPSAGIVARRDISPGAGTLSRGAANSASYQSGAGRFERRRRKIGRRRKIEKIGPRRVEAARLVTDDRRYLLARRSSVRAHSPESGVSAPAPEFRPSPAPVGPRPRSGGPSARG